MKFLMAFVASLVGGLLGFFLAAAAASVLAPALGISLFEGASGYFAAFVVGPIGAILGLIAGSWIVLRRAGFRTLRALLPRLLLVMGSVAALALAGLGTFWLMRPLVNPNGPAPRLIFEIRLPPGSAGELAKQVTIELQTSKNRMPATLQSSPAEPEPGIRGSVELYYRVWDRTLVLTLPDRTNVLFNLSLGLTPEGSKDFGSWRPADYVARPGQDEARRPGPADRYDIRYRIEW